MNLLFHHLQKTGGTSVRFWVGRGLGTEIAKGGMLELGPKSRSGMLPQEVYHGLASIRTALCTPPRAIMGHYVSENAAKLFGWGDDYVNVTIIRDPAERMFSQWHHFKRKMGPVASFEQWVTQDPEAKELPRICHCLECQFDAHAHRTEPMCHFYGSRLPESAPGNKDVLLRAKRFLGGCRVYEWSQTRGFSVPSMRPIPAILADMMLWFPELSFSDYKREHVSGLGAKVRVDQRRLVARNHPLDAELYEWARGKA